MCKPPLGKLKCNIDGAVFVDNNGIGRDAVAQNDVSDLARRFWLYEEFCRDKCWWRRNRSSTNSNSKPRFHRLLLRISIPLTLTLSFTTPHSLILLQLIFFGICRYGIGFFHDYVQIRHLTPYVVKHRHAFLLFSSVVNVIVFQLKGLFLRRNTSSRSFQCNFKVGSRINFPRQKAQVTQVRRKSSKRGGALGATCRAEKILVANRGEIAVRVIRTAHEMGIPCVAVYSTIDKDALHVKLADESVCIGEAPSSQSYLLIPNVLSAALSRNCTMLHPGYGFLAENAVFVEMCRDHRINFIGPNPDSIRVMGDKSTARETMKNAGVPTVPGSDGLLQSTEEAIKLAHEIGFPVMIKATAGGGGRGMRLAKEPDEFVKLLQAQIPLLGMVKVTRQYFATREESKPKSHWKTAK
ncbi:hypothetical protein Golob_023603 [Gossypium lobatum]|uniref:biotin carboxylase n=1 Tax=Gossypium lobatum TaxID=34289 RepID=A0A7J8LK50_9ROSI|nr:hypothetical protein [Gossypium lobatum]